MYACGERRLKDAAVFKKCGARTDRQCMAHSVVPWIQIPATLVAGVDLEHLTGLTARTDEAGATIGTTGTQTFEDTSLAIMHVSDHVAGGIDRTEGKAKIGVQRESGLKNSATKI